MLDAVDIPELDRPAAIAAEPRASLQRPEDLLDNRRWLMRSEPFPHVVATSVFKPDFYAAMAAQFRELLDRGLSEKRDATRFSRKHPTYDAYTFVCPADIEGPLAIFIS